MYFIETETETNEFSEEKSIKDTKVSPQVDVGNGQILPSSMLKTNPSIFAKARQNIPGNILTKFDLEDIRKTLEDRARRMCRLIPKSQWCYF